jgi:hypothetical protein
MIKKYLPSQDVNIFSYPSGRYNEDIIGLLARHTIEYAVGTERGVIQKKDGQYRIRRIGIHNDSSCTIPLFKYKLR